MIFTFRNFYICLFVSQILSGCTNQDEAQGKRINVVKEMDKPILDVPIIIPEMIASNGTEISYKTNSERPNLFLNSPPRKSWELNLNLGKSVTSPIIVKNKLIMLYSTGQLVCLELDTKKIVWESSVLLTKDSKDKLIGGGLAFDQVDNIYVTTSMGEILSIKMDKGTLNWRYKVDAPLLDAATFLEGDVFFTDATGVSRSLSSTGEVNWVFSGISYEQTHARTGKPVAAKNLLLVLSSSGILSALDIKKGEKKWDFKFNLFRPGYTQNSFGSFNGNPVVEGDSIYFGSINGQFNSLSTSGKVLWEVPIGLQGSPTLLDDSLFLVSDTNELMRLKKDTGNLIWSKTLGKSNKLNGFLASSVIGSKLWISSSDGGLTSYNPATGELIDKFTLNSSVSSSPMYHSGRILLLTDDGTLLVFE